MKNSIGTIIGFLAVAGGLISIFHLVVDTELAVGFVTISFGILALIWTSMAIGSLSPGSSLRRHVIHFLFCLIFMLLFTIWDIFSKLFKWKETVNQFMLYPGYVFIIVAFLIFVITAYQILSLGQEFGFGKQAKEIRKALVQRKAKAKKK